MHYFKIIKHGVCPVICNIPHCSVAIPDEFQNDFSISQDDLKREALTLADLYTEDLFKPLTDAFSSIISETSRMVVDIERFDDDNLEEMSKKGMGAIYEKSASEKLIRQLDEKSKRELLNSIYYPYHRAFEELADNCLRKLGKCLILDCHSFPSIPRSYELDKNERNLDICLGTEAYHTPKELFAIFNENLLNGSFKVKHNSPFSGTIVPARYLNSDRRVFSIMIEVNRKIYMDEDSYTKKPCFDYVSEKICDIINKSCGEFLKK